MDEARLLLIIAAIKALKPEDYTKAGTPNLAALKIAVPDITAEERDTVWAKMQAEKPATADPVLAPFDKTGASYVVTMRDSKAVTVWYRDGKEIGVE